MARIRHLIRLIKALAGALVLVAAAIYLVRAFDSRGLPDLAPEHRVTFDSEFSAEDESDTDWQAYLAIEDALAVELDRKIHNDGRPQSLFDRYSSESQMSPRAFERNWNRSYEFLASSPRGAAVLLHGLTDSPYSMLSTARLLVDAGVSVVVPRMPGHGFAVGGLRQVRWEDWTAAARIAISHAIELAGSEQSLLIVGYSNGGLLALEYTLRCGREIDSACPDKMILLSPAVAVSPASAVANLHTAVSWLPYFEKFAWVSILPEIDPFKFTSFPKRPGWEIFELGRQTRRLLEDSARVAKLPPILTFQSAVDNTVSSVAVVDTLYSRLPANGAKLVVYDVNRNDTAIHLMRQSDRNPVEFFKARAPLDYTVTVLGNRDHASTQVDASTLAVGELRFRSMATALTWPRGTYSLSHIALPFAPDDPLYGSGGRFDPGDPRIMLGAVAPRGEAGVLRLTSDYFLRARSNPFYSFQSAAISDWLAGE